MSTRDASSPPGVPTNAVLSLVFACALIARAQPVPDPPPAAQPAETPGDSPAVPPNESSAIDAATVGPPPEPAPAAPPGIPPTDPFPPTGIDEELDLMRPGGAIKRALDRLAEKTNLRLGIANTLLFQQASAGPGDRSAGGGDLDLWAKWTALGAGTKDTSVLAVSGEYRYQIGSQAPAALGGQIGTLLPTTSAFGERPPVIKEAYWDQRLFEDRFRFAIGRIDPENLFGGQRLQSSSTFFLYKAFSGNPTVAYPSPGPAVAAQIKPVSWFYTTAGFTDANASATNMDISGFFSEHEYLTFLETGFTPDIDGAGFGRYRLAVWHIDAREEANKPADQGFTISCDQDFGKSVTAFARYGHSEGDVTGVTNSVQGGAGIKAVFTDDDMLGAAAAWSEPAAAGERDEKTIEVFERLQLTPQMQLTFDVELIFDPSNAPDDDALAVFSVRFRVAF